MCANKKQIGLAAEQSKHNLTGRKIPNTVLLNSSVLEGDLKILNSSSGQSDCHKLSQWKGYVYNFV